MRCVRGAPGAAPAGAAEPDSVSLLWVRDEPPRALDFLSLAALCLCVMGCYSALPVFWTLPTSMLAGSAAAAGIALVNSIGNTGGFLGPTIVGFVNDATGSFNAALWTLAAFVAAAGIIVLALAPRARTLVATSESPPP